MRALASVVPFDEWLKSVKREVNGQWVVDDGRVATELQFPR